MEENKSCIDGSCSRQKCMFGVAPFLGGLVLALAFGWWIFPDLLFSSQNQPILFNHSVHLQKVPEVMQIDVTCSTCHSLRADGSFEGFPSISTCASCHTEILGEKPGESASKIEIDRYESQKNLVENYVAKGKEVEWVTHQRQPDNVFFSHAAHLEKCYTCHLTMKGQFDLGTPENPAKLCAQCHLTIAELSESPAVSINVMTDYSKTTMKMWECESCHAHPGHFNFEGKGRTVANNACYTCHK